MEGLLTRNMPGERPMSSDPNQVRTHCKICLLMIHKKHPTRWLTNPMGLSHEWCVKDKEEEKPA